MRAGERARVGILAACVLAACGGEEPPEEPRGVVQDLGTGGVPVVLAPDPFTRPSDRARDRGRTPPPPPAPAPTPPVVAEEARAPERDYAAELRTLAGDPAACGSLGTQTGRIAIPLSATVSDSGIVIRASVSGPIPNETRDCLVARLNAARFAGPVDGAPRTVRAELILEGSVAEATAANPTAPVRREDQEPIQGPSGVRIQGPQGVPIGAGAGETQPIGAMSTY